MKTNLAAIVDDTTALGERLLLGHPVISLTLQMLFILSMVGTAAAIAIFMIRRPRSTLLRTRPWNGVDLLQLTCVLLALASLAGLAIAWLEPQWGNRWPSSEWRAMTLSLHSLVFHWPILSFAASRMWQRDLRLGDAFGMCARRLPRDVLVALGLYIAALPPVAAASWGSSAVLRWVGLKPSLQPVLEATLDPNSGAFLIYLIFLATVIAPVAEEILFRGIALPVLARQFGPWPALGLSSLVFALVHFNLGATPPLFVLGLVFGLAYFYTGSLTVPMVMHAIVNSVSIAIATCLRR